ncbi:MAG: undecaprenyldiphospho-muramoylpentapeptide beta-N-acetylglucosaminyltransferase [Gammaproteobacteria bacterium]|nr:undecaprenyldiphospho-muramoylpentapeptide beta-N-acetylglucosaminyltransferase [Gammaproteobacteria bacterium]
MSSGRVLILAGGTGGHIFPALAVAGALREQGLAPCWMGAAHGMEERIVPTHGIPLSLIPIRGVRGKGWMRQLVAPFAILRATLAAIGLIRRIRPGVVLGMGGFVSGPGGLAAWLCRKPLIIHEQNALPGVTNRLLARLAARVLCAYPSAFPPGVGAEVTGNPIRHEIVKSAHPADDPAHGGPLRILVLGGSLGARSLNRVVPETLAGFDHAERLEILHQTGEPDADTVAVRYRELGCAARVVPFIAEMAEAYAWADCVICRAGALTLAELCVMGLPSVLIPYPHAVDDHQTLNARHLTDQDAAVLVRDAELSPETLAAALHSIVDDPARRQAIAARARALGKPRATSEVVRHCLELMPRAA